MMTLKDQNVTHVHHSLVATGGEGGCVNYEEKLLLSQVTAVLVNLKQHLSEVDKTKLSQVVSEAYFCCLKC